MVCAAWVAIGRGVAANPFAATVIDYAPAPGQLVNDPAFNDPARALGPPVGGGTLTPNNNDLVSLGGFGGSITLAFDHTVTDDAANPLGLDAIVFGNAFWVGGNANAHWAECAHLEICRDVNGNGQPDDDEPWYLIPGSHIAEPAAQFETQGWDDDVIDATYPPAQAGWLPPGQTGVWATHAFRLPPDVFEHPVVSNPNGPNAENEGIYGYADYGPTLLLGDTDGDNVVDDTTVTPAAFYTVPDDPLTVGVRPGSGGGDAFDIAWAIDAETGAPADLDGFDFLRVTNATNAINGPQGEMSAEIDAAADVAPGLMGDADADADIDLADFAVFSGCVTGPPVGGVPRACRTMDFDFDGDVDLIDFAGFQVVFQGSP